MDDYRDSLLSSYNYELDINQIAQTPAEPRHKARLLIVEEDKNNLSASRHKEIWNLQDELRPGDLIVINDTRVLKARLQICRPTGGNGELLLLEPLHDGQWMCLAKPAKKIQIGDVLRINARGEEDLPVKVLSRGEDPRQFVIQFPVGCKNARDIELLLNRYGEVPLPPYIHRKNLYDQTRYQTCFATNPGAVAAPTAGLHLSHEILDSFAQKGIKQARITLHVGLGTFSPLEDEDLSDLQLHSEWVEVKDEAVQQINQCQQNGGRVIAIGTTSVRALEGAFRAGEGVLKPFTGQVDLIIKPGYQFGVVDGLLTNFHLPKSSLLLLVSALIGRERLLSLYKEAIKRDYRFFSYGDAMWIKPESILPHARIKH